MDSVIHFEIPADDIKRAQKFYKDVFGWEITKWESPDAGMEYYTTVTTDVDKQTRMPTKPGAINGGMMKRNAPGEQPVIVINVKNLDDSLKKAQKKGATVVMPKMQVGDMGLYARARDPDGNIIGIWQNLKRM